MTNRSNEAWLNDLRSCGPSHESALNDLRAIIQKGLPYALSCWLSPSDPLFQPLVEEVTQETLLRVLDSGAQHLSQHTVDNYNNIFQKAIRFLGADIPISSIIHQDIWP